MSLVWQVEIYEEESSTGKGVPVQVVDVYKFPVNPQPPVIFADEYPIEVRGSRGKHTSYAWE